MNMDVAPSAQATPGDVHIARGGRWTRLLVTAAVLLALAVFGARFYKNTYTGLHDRNAMDVAQVARNVSEGKGYTTRFVRPLNVALLGTTSHDLPEINNAPLVPYITAVLFRLRAPSDQVVVWVSLGFTILTAFATFVLGLKLFGRGVGLLAASLFALSANTLDVACSGTEWPVVAFWLTLALLSVAMHHSAVAAGRRGAGTFWAVAAGILAALLYMTNSLLALVAVPLAIYFLVTGRARWLHFCTFLVVAIILSAPWACRETDLARFPVLGVRAWDMVSHTDVFPGDAIYRSTRAEFVNPLRVALFPIEHFPAFARKLVTGSSDLLGAMVLILGISVVPFAMVSVLYRFKQASANAVRGLMYGLAPTVILTAAMFSLDTKSMVVLAPFACVTASAYLLLLLEAKSLHPFYRRALIALFVFATAVQAVPSVLWPAAPPVSTRQMVAESYFLGLGVRGYTDTVYTDAPWMMAWRTLGLGVWLPRTDEDAVELEGQGFPLGAFILTSESDSYPSDEIWPALASAPFWRKYIADPEAVSKEQLEQVAKQPGASNAKDNPEAILRVIRSDLRTKYAVSDAVRGFHLAPNMPDCVRVFVRGDGEGEQ